MIAGQEMKYSNDRVTVKAGQPATLVCENRGALEHALVIDELGVAIAHVGPGHSAAANFTPDQPGSFTFYCSVPDHRQANMAGTLIVEP